MADVDGLAVRAGGPGVLAGDGHVGSDEHDVAQLVAGALVARVAGQAGAVGFEEGVPAGRLGAEDVDGRGVAGEVRLPGGCRQHGPRRAGESGLMTTRGVRMASGRGAAGVVRLIGRARRAVARGRAEDLFLYSAALAFYGLVSVAPLVVVALWITSLLVGRAQIHDAASELARLTPEALGADRALERVADVGTQLGLIAVAAALWPATAYGTALAGILDRFADDRDATRRRGRGAALLLVCLAPVLVLASLIASYLGATTLGDSPAEKTAGLAIAFVFAFAATFVTVAFIYKVFPIAPLGWRPTIHGTLVAAASISMLSIAYVAYLRFGVNFERRYASDALAAVVLLGLWLFAANIALLVGYRSAHRAGPSPEDGAA